MIVCPIVVFMMNVFAFFERTPEMLRHNINVFWDIPVAVGVWMVWFFYQAVSFACDLNATIPIPMGLPGRKRVNRVNAAESLFSAEIIPSPFVGTHSVLYGQGREPLFVDGLKACFSAILPRARREILNLFSTDNTVCSFHTPIVSVWSIGTKEE